MFQRVITIHQIDSLIHGDSWRHQCALHAREASAVHENGTKNDEFLGRFGSTRGLVDWLGDLETQDI